MLTSHGEIELAVKAMKQGAVDFVEKPFFADGLQARVKSWWLMPYISTVLDRSKHRVTITAKQQPKFLESESPRSIEN